jgi:protein-disulfide isomerase
MRFMKRSKSLITLAVLVSIFLGVTGARLLVAASAPGGVMSSAKSRGTADAPLKIVEFTDFQCPSCATASRIIGHTLQKDGDKIFFQLRYFPLTMHKNARKAAAAAECALEQGRFWTFEEELFATQKEWASLEDPSNIFLKIAGEKGLDVRRLRRCLSDPATVVKVEADVAEGKRMGVSATPTFFVNGKMAVGGEAFQQVLGEEMK